MKFVSLCFLICGLLLISACRSLPEKSNLSQLPLLESFRPVNPTASLDKHPLGAKELRELSFQWEEPTTGTQAAFQILVASDSQKLAAGVGDLWDSGKRISRKHTGIPYSGKMIDAETKPWWAVRIWGESGESSSFSLAQPIADAGDSAANIALLGGTLISRMDKYGWLETALMTQWSYQNLNVRNLGWPADDVQGTARSEFGSALNTKSWKPPDPEEGYGFEVIKEHIALVEPDVLLLGYGSEAAFIDSEAAWEEFVNGYGQLLTELESSVPTLILLSPHRFWHHATVMPDPAIHNQRLKRAADMIRELAAKRGHVFIDLYEKLLPIQTETLFSDNGIHLTDGGYQQMADLILDELGISTDGYELSLDESGKVMQANGVVVDQFVQTEKSFRFDLKADRLHPTGNLEVSGDHLVKIDGDIVRERGLTPQLDRKSDALQLDELRHMIIEKNRLHRLRINPLNKVYTHLFRQHEMGHLAYETDDYARLVEEKEELIARLRVPQSHRYEVERLEPWKSPREYPDHEVPEVIAGPDPQAELAAFTISEGFELNLFASDPMIANPISITWDNKGRAWVATSTTYPQIKPGSEPIDRIVILEDTDQDGVADKSTVFAEGLLIPHSVMPVKGGAYAFTTTEILFLADHDGDDRADETRVIYSGFGHGDVHHTLHCMRWAPWGDLHFSQSININSFVETPYGPRKLNGSGFWEFDPRTERLEIFARGMINPWGEAFDDWGQIFATDGAGGEGPTYVFPGSAHRTAVGVDKILPGLLTSKPKNTAAEIISGSHLPDHWQGSLLASDFRANRTVRYALTEKGSGYAAEEVETVLHSSHRSYRPVDTKLGPDGAAYIVDWYSPIIDHGEVDFYHPSRDKSHGRIWRLKAKGRPLNPISEIAGASDTELLDLLKSDAQFDRIHANRELVMRNCSPATLNNWLANLSPKDSRYEHHRVEALWLSVALDAPNTGLLKSLLQAKNHHARSAAARMVPRCLDPTQGEKALTPLVRDSHAQVRMEAANALRILASPNAVNLALQALDFPIDRQLDYVLWLTVRELEAQWLPDLLAGKTIFEGNFDRIGFALFAADNSEATQSLATMVEAGQLTGEAEKNALMTIANLGGSKELEMVLNKAASRSDIDLLKALAEAPSTNGAKPEHAEVLKELLLHDNAEIRTLALQLYGRWEIPLEGKLLVQQMEKSGVKTNERMAAADALVSLGEMDLLKTVATTHEQLLVRNAALAAWAKADPEAAIQPAIKRLTETSSATQARLIIGTYCGLNKGPEILRKNLVGKQVHENVALAGIRVAQASGRDMSGLIAEFTRAGSVKAIGTSLSPAQRTKLLADMRSSGNASRGREIYLRATLVCATCHAVKGDGGKVGPDLSTVGAYMTPESILESIINPSTSIKQGYETVVITKPDGTVVSGTLDRKTEQGARVRDAVGNIIFVPNSEIDKLDVSTVSLMPPGLTSSLRPDELADLMKYLTGLGKGK